MAAIEEFDSFKFMLIVLFVIFMLILFLAMITYNVLYGRKKYKVKIATCSPDTPSEKCIPKPTPIPPHNRLF